MKDLAIIFDTKDLNLAEEEKKLSSSELFNTVVNFTISSYAQQTKGLLKNERNQAYEIQDKLKLATENKEESIKLEDQTFGFLAKIFRETKLNPNNILRKVEENIDNVKHK